MIYVDSNVFVYPVLYDPLRIAKAGQALKVLARISRGELNAATSSLTWDEVVWAARKIDGRQSASVQGRRLLELPTLKVLPVTFECLTTAQELIEDADIRPRDSLHASVAITNGMREIISDDKDFDRIKSLKRVSIASVAETKT